MNLNNLLLKHTEQELASLGAKGRLLLREQASKNKDLESLLDIATYRFAHGASGLYISLLPEMFFLYGRSRRVEQLQELLREYNFALFGLPDSCLNRAKAMLSIGLSYPNLDKRALDFLEELWCDSEAFEWMDIIMYDCESLPRKLNRFDKNLLNNRTVDFSEELIIAIWECFEYNKDEENEDEPYYYDRKTNQIGKKDWTYLGKGEFVIENDKHYNEVNQFITDKFGESLAIEIAQELIFGTDSVEEFRNSTLFTVTPQDVYDACRDSDKAKQIAEWFSKDFLNRCNQ